MFKIYETGKKAIHKLPKQLMWELKYELLWMKDVNILYVMLF
jgi:hypothetical protein